MGRHTWTSPDALRRGEWGSVLQGYWSPLYPLLAAATRSVASAVGGDPLAAVHLLNAGLVIVGGALVHRLIVTRHERQGGRSALPAALWLRCSWAAFAICSLVYARVDSVTPDLLLLVVMVAVLDELLRHGVERPVRLGLLLGATFMVKTSSWPWLIVTWAWLASPWGARAPRRAMVRGAIATLAVMLAWLVPLSAKSGRPTLGSTGRLNACWFLRDCDGQSPDTHRGEHARYATLTTSQGGSATYARFAAAAGSAATYEPWTDPTAWAEGVRTQHESPLALGALVGVVLDNVADALRYLGVYLFLAALAPALLWWVVARPRMAWDDDARLALRRGGRGCGGYRAVRGRAGATAPHGTIRVAARGGTAGVDARGQRPAGSRRGGGRWSHRGGEAARRPRANGRHRPTRSRPVDGDGRRARMAPRGGGAGRDHAGAAGGPARTPRATRRIARNCATPPRAPVRDARRVRWSWWVTPSRSWRTPRRSTS